MWWASINFLSVVIFDVNVNDNIIADTKSMFPKKIGRIDVAPAANTSSCSKSSHPIHNHDLEKCIALAQPWSNASGESL